MANNYIFFLNPTQSQQMIKDTLAMTDFAKAIAVDTLIMSDGYSSIIGFTTSGSIIVSSGMKSDDKRAQFLAEFEKALHSRGMLP